MNLVGKEKLKKILIEENRQLKSKFALASISGGNTPNDVAQRRELSVSDLFRKFFAFPYQIAKGNIVDSYGNCSRSIDTIVLNPTHPQITTNNEYSIIVAEAVDFAIEVKSDFTGSEINRALEQVQSVKKIKSAVPRVNNTLQSQFQLSEHKSKQIPTIIVAQKTYKNIESLIEKIFYFYKNNGASSIDIFDLIITLDGNYIINSGIDHYEHINNIEGILTANFGDDVLFHLLRWIKNRPESNPHFQHNPLTHYLDDDTANYLSNSWVWP